jgi:hypothetical protein
MTLCRHSSESWNPESKEQNLGFQIEFGMTDDLYSL